MTVRRATSVVADAPTPRASDIDVWAAVAAALDPGSMRPALASHVELREFVTARRRYGVVANHRDLVHLRLEGDEVDLVASMDGSASVAELVVVAAEASGSLDVDVVTGLVDELHAEGFLTDDYQDVYAAVDRALERPTMATRLVRAAARSFSVEWRGAERFVRRAYDAGLRLCFSPTVATALVLIGLVGLVAFVDVARSQPAAPDSPAAALLVLVLSWVTTAAHELGHALVLIHRGRRIKNAGFLLHFGSPAFFVDSTDGLLLPRRDRILQSAAGPFADVLFGGLAGIAAWATAGSTVGDALFLFAAMNYFVLLTNLAPFLELDGYWILTEVLDTPDLRQRALAFVRFELVDRLRRRRITASEVGLTAYTVLGLAFTVFSLVGAAVFWEAVFGSLIRGLWHLGVVGRLALVVLAVFVGGPVIRALVIAGRSVWRRVTIVVSRVRFRMETAWRVEGARLLDDSPLFADLPADVLGDVAGRLVLRRVGPGVAVVRQGDHPDACFVVRTGALEVVEEAGSDERVLGSLQRGDVFGELALVQGTRRTATVRASEPSEVFELPRSAFERLLAPHLQLPERAQTVQALTELRSIRAFAHLPSDRLARVLAHGRWVTFAAGTDIVRRGEPGDAFYGIRSGRLAVERRRGVVAHLGAGDHFGERALLSGGTRQATVRALTAVRAFRLDADGFAELLRATPARSAGRHVVTRTWEH